MGKNKENNKVEKDICVICGCKTPYDKNEHIDNRMLYVECVGQLCKQCWDEVYQDER